MTEEDGRGEETTPRIEAARGRRIEVSCILGETVSSEVGGESDGEEGWLGWISSLFIPVSKRLSRCVGNGDVFSNTARSANTRKSRVIAKRARSGVKGKKTSLGGKTNLFCHFCLVLFVDHFDHSKKSGSFWQLDSDVWSNFRSSIYLRSEPSSTIYFLLSCPGTLRSSSCLKLQSLRLESLRLEASGTIFRGQERKMLGSEGKTKQKEKRRTKWFWMKRPRVFEVLEIYFLSLKSRDGENKGRHLVFG